MVVSAKYIVTAECSNKFYMKLSHGRKNNRMHSEMLQKSLLVERNIGRVVLGLKAIIFSLAGNYVHLNNCTSVLPPFSQHEE